MDTKYEVLRTIGRGAYGAAMLVRDKQLNQYFVIKEVNIFDMSEAEAEKATKEAYYLKKLNHPNIVQYVDSFIDGKNLIIVMEYADAGDLERYIRRHKAERMEEKKILYIFIQILLGLKCVHDNNMLHRDLKPGNLFLNKDGMVKLGDFGVARMLKSTIGLANTVIGTPHYLSPEICDSHEYDQKSDIWSLGCILHELCTQKPTFDGNSVPAMVMKIMHCDFEPIPDTYSRDLAHCVGLMLKFDPKERPRVADILDLPFMQPVMKRYCARMVKLRAKKKQEKLMADELGKAPRLPALDSDGEDVMDLSDPELEVLLPAGSGSLRPKRRPIEVQQLAASGPIAAPSADEVRALTKSVPTMVIPPYKGKPSKAGGKGKHKHKAEDGKPPRNNRKSGEEAPHRDKPR